MSQHSTKDSEFSAIIAQEKAKCKAKQGTCWICHNVIDCDLDFNDPMAFTLDHVQAASTPGVDKHRRSNLKWAHRKCNSRRGNGKSRKLIITTRKW